MESSLSRPLSQARPSHWAELDEFSFVAGMRLLLWCYRALGRWPFRLLLFPVVLWYALAKPTARAASRDYLRRIAALRSDGHEPGWRDVVHHFAAFGEVLLDKLLLWGGWYNTAAPKFYGRDLIARQIAARRGGIFICAHLGNLELCRVLARREPGLKLTVLTHTLHAKKFNRLLARLDPQSQINLLQVSEITPETATALAARLEQGEFIAIAGDRIPISVNGRVAAAPFLGAPAQFPVGPYILAHLLQCPTYTLFAMRRGEVSEIHIELFRDAIHLPRHQRDPLLQELATDFAGRLQRFCLAAPFQWFNFYDFWRLPAKTKTDELRS